MRFAIAITGSVKIKTLQYVTGSGKLPFSAVDDDQVREIRMLFKKAVVAAFHDLGDRCYVVDALDRLDLKPAIVPLLRHTPAELHHRTYH